MSMWRKTLEYLGLVEEADEFDEMPERFEEPARTARPAMHDTTGPIDVVRVDDHGQPLDEDVAAEVEEPHLHSVGDLTEPVAVVEDTRRVASRGGSPAPRAPRRARSGRPGADSADLDDDNVRQLRPEPGRPTMPGGMGRRVAIVAVADYEAGAREVGQRYRQSVPVVFDLTDAPVDDRRRVLDFVAGVTYALKGEMLKVGRRSFLIVPQGGEVSDTEWDRLASLGYRP